MRSFILFILLKIYYNLFGNKEKLFKNNLKDEYEFLEAVQRGNIRALTIYGVLCIKGYRDLNEYKTCHDLCMKETEQGFATLLTYTPPYTPPTIPYFYLKPRKELIGFNCFRKAAKRGNAEAQYWLGWCYYNGRGVRRDVVKAVYWCQKAAEQGVSNAQYNLGFCYYFGIGVDKNDVLAKEWYRRAAEQGHPKAVEWLSKDTEQRSSESKTCPSIKLIIEEIPDVKEFKNFRKAAKLGVAEAQYRLCWCYYTGRGVRRDVVKAVYWCQKAAEQGMSNAQYNLGFFYYYGVGLDRDLVKTVKWYRKAADQGNPRALEWFTKASDQEYIEAQKIIGMYYYSVDEDYVKAVEWFRKAAEQGEAEAQNRLGQCYRFGEGVEMDFAKAEDWFCKAIEQGNKEAQCNLGECYYCRGDYETAVDCFVKAAMQGVAKAQYNLGMCYFLGHGVTENDYDAAIWYREAAEQGYDEAQYYLGLSYFWGYGVSRSNRDAFFWLEKAAKQGNVDAQDCLGYHNKFLRIIQRLTQSL